MIIRILYSLYLGFFRRWFGGGFDKLWDNRAFQNCLNVIVTSIVLYLTGKNIYVAILGGLALQFLYFCSAHGPAFDVARDYPPSEEKIKRYKKYFWNKWCEFLVPKQSWYRFGYDFLWMFFRYELPSILISILLWNIWFSFAGLAVTLIYSICWSFYDRGKTNHPTARAEVFVGFITGLLLLL